MTARAGSTSAARALLDAARAGATSAARTLLDAARVLGVALLLGASAAATPEHGKEAASANPAAGRAQEAPGGAASAEPQAPAGVATPRLPLAPLPKPPSLEIPPPDPAALEALDAHLARVSSKDPSERETAVQEILEVEPDRLPAIHRRLEAIAESSNKEDMKALLGGIRDKAREVVRDRVRAEGGREKVATPDYLEMLTSHARPDSRTWRDLVAVVAMSRMLRQIGTVGAARELVNVYARFGEFLRVDTQLQLQAMGDRAVAALIEAERHPAPKIASWAARQLDALGKAIPGEAVQVQDPEVLADVLRAYGRARDPDAGRLVISFANSERTQIREAARQSVVLMGEISNWQLRDTYENVVGKKPPREWSWDRTARELFAEFDRMRLAQVYVLFEKGVAAEHAGKLDEMADDWDQVLAESPIFERAGEMIPGYLAYARAHLDDARDKSVRALRRVARLGAPDDPSTRAAQSLLLTLESEDLLARHIADPVLPRRALELDPANARARRLVDRMTQGDVEVERKTSRYLAAASIAVAALAAVLFVLFRKRPPAAPA